MADATVPTRRITQLRDGDGEAAPQAGAPPPRSAVSAAPGPLLPLLGVECLAADARPTRLADEVG
jgi:hypothetical protein